MKKILFIISILLFVNMVKAQTGIGTTTPHASAKLEVASTTKGFLPPRMTATERGNIPSPAPGLMVYQTDGTTGLYYFNGTLWIYIINSTTNVLSVVNGGTGTTTSIGTGSVVLNTNATLANPTLTTPSLGVASGTSLALTGTTASNSTSSGTLTVAGGFGVVGQIYAGGIQNTPIWNTTANSGSFTTIVASGNITATGNLTGGNSSSSSISGFAGNLFAPTLTSNAYTVQPSDNGKILTFNNASNVTLNLPSLFTGFNCMIIQLGAGQVVFNQSSTTITNRSSFNKTAGRNAIATIVGISSTSFIVAGDMSN